MKTDIGLRALRDERSNVALRDPDCTFSFAWPDVVAAASPADGATRVPASAQLEIAATAPLDTTAATAATVTLTSPDPAAPAVALQRVLSGSGRVLALVPATALAAATTYRLAVSGLLDVYGGGGGAGDVHDEGRDRGDVRSRAGDGVGGEFEIAL